MQAMLGPPTFAEALFYVLPHVTEYITGCENVTPISPWDRRLATLMLYSIPAIRPEGERTAIFKEGLQWAWSLGMGVADAMFKWSSTLDLSCVSCS